MVSSSTRRLASFTGRPSLTAFACRRQARLVGMVPCATTRYAAQALCRGRRRNAHADHGEDMEKNRLQVLEAVQQSFDERYRCAN